MFEKRWAALLACAVFLAPAAAGAVDWNGLISRDGGSRVFFGVVLGGPDSFERNAGHAFAPASTSKLFSSAAALELLGADFRYETRIEWHRVEGAADAVTGLTLVGGGDPSWGMSMIEASPAERVDRIVEALAERGVREVRGPIRLESVDSRWDSPDFPAAWEPKDFNYCYGAILQAFNLAQNCATFQVTGRRSGRWSDPSIPVRVEVDLIAGSRTILNPEAVISDMAPGRFRLRITGTWATAQSIQLPIHDVRGWLWNLLVRSLDAHGIAYRSTGYGKPVGDAPETMVSLSPPLGEVLRAVDKDSINMGAEASLRAIGLRFGDPSKPLLDGSLEVLRAFIERVADRNPGDAGHFVEEVDLRDGSGVSRHSRVTPRAMMLFLRDQMKLPHFEILLESLSIAGVDGTLKSRMKGTAAEGKLRAKTGTLSGYYQLAGYVPHADGLIPFVMLSATSPDNRAAARAAQDRVGAALAGF